MPIDNTALMPPQSRFRTIITALGDTLVPIVDEVRYFLRLPEEENKDKVIYIEPDLPIVLVNENLDGYQRSVMPFRVKIYGFIADGDTRVLADFVAQVMDTLNTPAARESYRTIFAPGSYDGFTIEQMTVSSFGFGEEIGQFELSVETMVNHPNP